MKCIPSLLDILPPTHHWSFNVNKPGAEVNDVNGGVAGGSIDWGPSCGTAVPISALTPTIMPAAPMQLHGLTASTNGRTHTMELHPKVGREVVGRFYWLRSVAVLLVVLLFIIISIFACLACAVPGSRDIPACLTSAQSLFSVVWQNHAKFQEWPAKIFLVLHKGENTIIYDCVT